MIRRPVLFGVSLVVLAACAAKNPGVPSPGPSNSDPVTTSSAEVPAPGVPKIEDPIDVAHFRQAPCDALTQDQITGLLGSDAVPKPDIAAPAGPSCTVRPAGITQAGVIVIFTNADQQGLTSVYRAKGNQYKFFMPLEPINGYPVVAYGVEDERKSVGRCAIALGTSDTQAVDINVTQSEQNIGKIDPCAAAHDIAAQVLGNLRGAK